MASRGGDPLRQERRPPGPGGPEEPGQGPAGTGGGPGDCRDRDGMGPRQGGGPGLGGQSRRRRRPCPRACGEFGAWGGGGLRPDAGIVMGTRGVVALGQNLACRASKRCVQYMMNTCMTYTS